MPTYKIDGQVIDKSSGKLITKAQVTLTVIYHGQTIQETKAKIEQDGFFRMSFYNEFIPGGTKADFRVEDQNGNNLPTDYSLTLRPGQEPVRVKIPVTVSVKQYTVQGTIANQNNQPIKSLLVKAIGQNPQTPENLLGTPVYTDDKGKYKITYKDGDFQIGDRESGGANIIIGYSHPKVNYWEGPKDMTILRNIPRST